MKQTKPHQKNPETDAIFGQLQKVNQAAATSPSILWISVDAKATVKLGPVDRDGKTRVCTTACEPDFATQTVTPFGIFLPLTDELFIYFVSFKLTRDGIVDIFPDWWPVIQSQRPHLQTLVFNPDNDPENLSSRTQFMKRLVPFAQIHLVVV